MVLPQDMRGDAYWVKNSVACTQTSRILWIYLVVGGLKDWQTWVDPRLFCVEGIPNDDTNERVAEVRTNVAGEILDARVNPLPVDHSWEWVNGERILVLGIVSGRDKVA